jgi:CheY-like chemotaxis protein
MERAPDGNEPDRVAVANRAEELMLRTRRAVRRMRDRVRKALAATPPPGPHPAPPPAVLVAEDEPMIRDLLGLILRSLGFRVWPAADGLEAVDLYRRHRDEIGAVVLDIHMPRLDGPATLRALRDLDPQVGCVFITGHPGDYDEAALAAMGAVAVLRKPFLPGDLDAALRRLPRFAGLGMTPCPGR